MTSNAREYMREYMRERREQRPSGVSIRQFERDLKQKRDRLETLAYRRRISANFRERHPGYSWEHCKQWRARKARQAVVIDKFLAVFDGFEHAKRCAEVRAEARWLR
jgi:hypothetical protein